MDFEIYCDESGLEALTNKKAHKYVGIGGIWFPANDRAIFKEKMELVKSKHHITGELKWKKVSPAYYDVYKEIIDLFFEFKDVVRFRIILIESENVNLVRFNNLDAELSFYKFYYQLLHHWIFDFNNYDVFLDLKINRNRGRLKELEKVLNNANLTSDIKRVQGLPSEQSLGIQLADILTGLVTSKFNNEVKPDSTKAKLIKYVEDYHLKKVIVPTPKWEEKLNVFKINIKGGW